MVINETPRPCHADSCLRAREASLIELMIAVAVAGILLAVALPAYQDSTRKGRRGDAFAAIAALQQSQERWRANSPEYSTSLSDLRG
jgi:type IV pilus assembly protein PilE